MPEPINQHVLIRDDNHLIRYARTRHLTITTQVSRFVYLLHTAPTSPRAPLLRIVQQPPEQSQRGTAMRRLNCAPGDQTSGGPHDRVPTHHLGTHPILDPLMPNRNLLIWAITGIWRMWRWQ